jgi:hypothetical protein
MKSTKKAAKFNLLKSTVVRLNGKPRNNYLGVPETTVSDTSTTTSIMTISHF